MMEQGNSKVKLSGPRANMFGKLRQCISCKRKRLPSSPRSRTRALKGRCLPGRSDRRDGLPLIFDFGRDVESQCACSHNQGHPRLRARYSDLFSFYSPFYDELPRTPSMSSVNSLERLEKPTSLEKLEEVQRVIRLHLETKQRLERELETAECSSALTEEVKLLLDEAVSKISELQAQEKLQVKILQNQGYVTDNLMSDGSLEPDQCGLSLNSSLSRKSSNSVFSSPGGAQPAPVASSLAVSPSPLSIFPSDAPRSLGHVTEAALTENDRRTRQPSGEQHELPPSSPLAQDSSRAADDIQRPPSPMKNHLRVYMPNNQRTMIIISRGKSVRDALKKKLSNRSISCDMCKLFRVSDNQIIDWDTDTSELDGQELMLQYLPEYSFRQRSVPHVFVRKTYFRITYCDFCHRNIFQGYLCQTCDIKFHARCATQVPERCIMDLSEVSWLPPKYGGRGIRKRSKAESDPPHLSWLPKLRTSASVDGVSLTRSPSEGCLQTVGSMGSVETSVSGGGGGTDMQMTSGENLQQQYNSSKKPVMPRQESPSSSLGQSTLSTTVTKLRTRTRSQNSEWEVDMSEVEVGKRIGAGSFGVVYKGYWYGAVAVKILNVDHPTPAQVTAFRNEVDVFRKTRHSNVLLFVGFTVRPKLSIITQWCEGSSLYHHLHVAEEEETMLVLANIARQTAQAMDYLHARNIMHRDLKSNNIFLLEDKTVKVGDFGLATMQTHWDGNREGRVQPVGSILWMAPEIIRMSHQNPYSFQSDVYAFGVVLYELMTGSLPYNKYQCRDQLLWLIGSGRLKLGDSTARKDTPKAFKRLFYNCIEFEPEKRPLFPQILSKLNLLMEAIPKISRCRSLPTLKWGEDGTGDLFSSDLHFGLMHMPSKIVGCDESQSP